VWWVVSIFHIGVDCGTISLRRKSEGNLVEMVRRKTKLRRMFLLLQRIRRKEIVGGT
jgi:hypothetical protein